MNFPVYAGTLLAASTLLGSLAVPYVRNKTFGTIRQHWLCGELDFDRLDHDQQSIIMKNGGYVRVFRVSGMTYETKSEEHQDNLLKSRSVLLNALGDTGMVMRFFALKHIRDVSYKAEWPSGALQEIGSAETEIFRGSYYLDWYLMVQSKSFVKLEKASKTLLQSLKQDYGIVLLERGQLLAFIQYLISGSLLNGASFEGMTQNISATLPASDLHFNKQTGIITTTTPKTRYSRMISIRAFSESADGMILAQILALHGEIEVMQLVEPQSREASIFQLTAKRNEQSNALDFMRNTALLEETEAILELINDNSSTLFFTQMQIRISASSIPALEQLQESVAEILSKKRISWSVDTLNAPNYYFNRFPFKDYQSRELKLLNQNIAALWTFHNSPSGQKQSPWGKQPLRLFKTPIGQNYSFNFHIRAAEASPGHALIIAPTGSGKSTLMMHLLGGLAKFRDTRSYIFDSNEGTRFMVEAMGGEYQSISEMKFNPLDCPDTENNRLHIASLLRMMGQCSDQEIQHFLQTAFDDLSRDTRSFNAIYDYAFSRGTPSHRDFARWVTDRDGNRGLYADIFNARHDSLSGTLDQSFMTAINMADALNDEVLAAPLVAHIAEGIKLFAQQSDKGFCIFIDEAAALLRNKGFAALVQVMYREYRKLGGAVIMAFQDPNALQESGIASAVQDNISTLILFPNAQAKKADYAAFNLSDEQMQFVIQGSGMASERSVLVIKREASTGFEESTILDIDLGSYGAALRFYRSGAVVNTELQQLKKQYPEDWKDRI